MSLKQWQRLVFCFIFVVCCGCTFFAAYTDCIPSEGVLQHCSDCSIRMLKSASFFALSHYFNPLSLYFSLSHLLHLITYRYSRIAQRNALLSQAKCCNIHTYTNRLTSSCTHTHTHICVCLCIHVSSFSSLSLLRWRLKLIFNNITH